MAFGDLLRGIVAQVNPFDNGKTYGSYNPPKRKPQPGDPGYVAPNPRVQIPGQTPGQFQQSDEPQIKTQTPQNLFAGLQNNLTLPGTPNNTPQIKTNSDLTPLINPSPGTVVQPTTPPKPPIPLWKRAVNDVGNVASAAAGTGLGVLRAGEGLVGGAPAIADQLTHAINYVPRKIAGNDSAVNRTLSQANRDADSLTKTLNKPVDWLAKKTDEAAIGYGPGARAVYKPVQIATNVAAVVPGAVEGGANLASKLSGVKDLSQSEGALGLLGRAKNFVDVQRTSPLLTKIDSLLGSNIAQSRFFNNLINTGEDIGPGAAIAAEDTPNVMNGVEQLTQPPTRIPVATGIDVNAPPSEPINIPVRNVNQPANLIQEVGGDAKVPTSNAEAAANAVNVRRVEAAAKADTGLPDTSIEGVTPRPVEKPFVLDPKEVATTQDKIVSDYADTLRNMGQGNGTQLVPDGEGGYTRTSNNVRTAETAGKDMTTADWQDEARRQLEAGKADSSVQGAFNDAANPEVQSTLVKGERPAVEPGRPITVKDVRGIDVTDQTNVPQGLPETPGKVRVTEATAPSVAKSEAVAAQTPVAADTKTPVTDTNTPAAATETLPQPNESDADFLRRQATDIQSNIQRAVDSLKTTKKMTKAERAQRAAAGQTAYEEAKAAGKSMAEQEAARKAAYGGAFDRMDYQGSPIHSGDEQRLRDMVDEHYKDMPYQAGNVREAFSKLFHAGEPGWQSEAGNHIIPSDIKNIRKFLNESVPNPDGNGGLGDFASSALDELANQGSGPGRVANAIGLQRALRFTADISATGRQALPEALSHPVEFAQAAKKSFEVMFSHEKYQQYASELSNSKVANYVNDRLGAHLSVISDPIGQQDDIYRNSEWAKKIPGVKQVVAASERQYNTILTEMRLRAGTRFIDAAGGIGNLEKVASDSGDAEGFLKAIGTVANVNTGRGFGKALDTGASKILSDVLVSPRGLAARIQRFNPGYYINLWKANPAAAQEAIRSMAIQTGVTVSALAAANKAGIYEDGQIKVGNTRYDITGGAANMVRTAVRVAQFMSGDRATTPFNSAEGEVEKWARNQLSPFLASALDTIGIHPDPKTGQYVNHLGEPVTAGNEVLNNLTPVNASQVNQDLQLGTPPAQTAVNAGLNTVGIGVNTYQSAADKKAQDTSPVQQKKGDASAELADLKNKAGDGYSLQQLSDGKFAYNMNGDVKTAATLKEAQKAIAQDTFDKSGNNFQVDPSNPNTVFRRDAQGKVTATPKVKFDYQVGSATLIKQKNAEDLQGWLKTAQGQLDSIDKQLKDPSIDPLDAMTLQNDAQSLVDDMAKYQAYGGFKKPKGFGSGPKAVDTSFGGLKAGSFAPQVQQYQSIDAKSGSVPHISVVRPNIVHKITSSGGI